MGKEPETARDSLRHEKCRPNVVRKCMVVYVAYEPRRTIIRAAAAAKVLSGSKKDSMLGYYFLENFSLWLPLIRVCSVIVF